MPVEVEVEVEVETGQTLVLEQARRKLGRTTALLARQHAMTQRRTSRTWLAMG